MENAWNLLEFHLESGGIHGIPFRIRWNPWNSIQNPAESMEFHPESGGIHSGGFRMEFRHSIGVRRNPPELMGEGKVLVSIASAASKGRAKAGKGKAKVMAGVDSKAEAAAEAQEALFLAKIEADQAVSGDDYEDNEQSSGDAPTLANFSDIRSTVKARLAILLSKCFLFFDFI